MHQQPERAAAVRLAQVEFQAVHFGEAMEREQVEIAKIPVCQ